MSEKIEKKQLIILRLLQEADRPLSSTQVTERMLAMGLEVSERTIRHYLLQMDKQGLTDTLGKRGRRITEEGRGELAAARVVDKIGLLAARIDTMTYRMNFDLASKSGNVVINVSIIDRANLAESAGLMSKVFAAGYGMGKLMTLLQPGEKAGDMTIPEGSIGIGTVCSITLNGVLLQQGIPTKSLFGGLLELRAGKPSRFVEIIYYEGTTLDPLEVFISSRMTDYAGAVSTGNGRIGASFREVPADARERVLDVSRELDKIGMGGLALIGYPGTPLLDIPVSEGRIGAIIIGGLNPVAILEERGIRVQSRALAALADYKRLFRYEELGEKIASIA